MDPASLQCLMQPLSHPLSPLSHPFSLEKPKQPYSTVWQELTAFLKGQIQVTTTHVKMGDKLL